MLADPYHKPPNDVMCKVGSQTNYGQLKMYIPSSYFITHLCINPDCNILI
jgi:hypothetical protein